MKPMAKTCVRCRVVKMWGHEVPVADRGRMCLFCRKFYCEPCLEAHKSEEEHKNNELKWVWGRDWKKMKTSLHSGSTLQHETRTKEESMTERPTRTKGRGRWRQVGKPFYGSVALGNGTQYKIGCWITERNELFVGVEGKGCYTFPGWPSPGYVQDKLGLKFAGDAKNLCDFINHQLGGIAEDYEEEGEYQDQFTGEVEADARL